MESPRTKGRSDIQAFSRRFTLVELLVVVAIIAILAAMLLPVLSKARHQARRAAHVSDNKQVYLGYYMYSQDNNEHMVFAEGHVTNTPLPQPLAYRDWDHGYSPDPYDIRFVAEDYGFMANTGNVITQAEPWDGPGNTGGAVAAGPLLRWTRVYALSQFYDRNATKLAPLRLPLVDPDTWFMYDMGQIDPSGNVFAVHCKGVTGKKVRAGESSYTMLHGSSSLGSYATRMDGAIGFLTAAEIQLTGTAAYWQNIALEQSW